MESWKKLDLLGRVLILLAIGLQLTLKTGLEDINRKGDVFYIMENQYHTASMIYNLAATSDRAKTSKAISERLANITLYSEREKSLAISQAGAVNIIFAILFGLGSIIMIIGRFIELK